MTAPGPLTLEDLERLARKQTGCTDGGCVFGHPGGMHTNGGCKCVPRGGHVHPDEARAVRDKVKALVADRSMLLAALRSVMAERDALRALCDRVREAWGDGIACSCFSFASSCGCNEPAVRAAIEALGPGGEK